MKHLILTALLLSVGSGSCSVGCGVESPQTYQQPPADSYVVATHELKVGDAVTKVQGATVTPGFFAATGLKPLLGRFIIDADFAPSAAARVTVLSHQLWVDRFASSPTAIGRTIEVDGSRVVIVGIAPKGFDFPDGAMMWMTK